MRSAHPQKTILLMSARRSASARRPPSGRQFLSPPVCLQSQLAVHPALLHRGTFNTEYFLTHIRDSLLVKVFPEGRKTQALRLNVHWTIVGFILRMPHNRFVMKFLSLLFPIRDHLSCRSASPPSNGNPGPRSGTDGSRSPDDPHVLHCLLCSSSLQRFSRTHAPVNLTV
jgi:hypothetical protein